MARKKKEPEASGGCPAWLATYGDMITLVLTFFVLLYSMSSLDVEKWKSLVINIGNVPPDLFSIMEETGKGDAQAEAPPEVPEDEYIEPTDEWTITVQGIVDKVNEHNAGEGGTVLITVVFTEAQVIIRCEGDILFDRADAVVKPESYPMIHFIMDELVMPEITARSIRELSIQGHADIQPLKRNVDKYIDNLGLSQARAANVQRYVEAHYEIPGEMLSSTGYGESRPVIPGLFGTDESVWVKNRRVEFVMLRNYSIDEETGDFYEAAP